MRLSRVGLAQADVRSGGQSGKRADPRQARNHKIDEPVQDRVVGRSPIESQGRDLDVQPLLALDTISGGPHGRTVSPKWEFAIL
jgi:hypothetical protein